MIFMAKGINMDTLYFIAIILLAVASLLNSGLSACLSTLASGIFGYIIIKLISKYLEK